MSRKRKFVFLAIGFSVVLFLALDLIVGSVFDIAPRRSFRTSHPYYHHALHPYQQQVTKWGPRSYEMITNSLGFRDRVTREVPLVSDRFRIVLIGDSMVEGLGVEYERTLAGLLQTSNLAEPVEVLNAAVVSYSPRLYNLKVRYLLKKVGLDFDRLIVFIDISDIQDELHYESFQPATVAPALTPSHGWWRQHSLLAHVIDQRVSDKKQINNHFRTDSDVNVWMEATKAYGNPDVDPEQGRWLWTVDESIYAAWGERGLEFAGTHMEQLIEVCRAHDVEVTVVVYPAPVQMFANDIDSLQVRYWRAFCERLQVDFIDLFPEFINYSFAGPGEVYERYFIQSDVHWNEAGHQLVADAIGTHLQEVLELD